MQKISHFPCRQLIMKTRLPKVLLKQATLPPLVAHPPIAAAHNRSTIFARWHQCTYLGPPYSPPQTAARSVQLFLYGRYSLYALYVTLCRSIPPKILALSVERAEPNPTQNYWAYPNRHPKQHLDWVSHFQNTWSSLTDRQTNELDW